MIDVYFWPTPNGFKIPMFLEEAGVPYRLIPVDLSSNEQYSPDFLKISPTHRIPAIVDHEPEDGGAPVSVFESAAILTYLAEKYGKLLPKDARGKKEAMEWLIWQVSSLGPIGGQVYFFALLAEEKNQSALNHYYQQLLGLFELFDKRLEGRDWLAGDYSIADIACYPWIAMAGSFQIDLDGLLNVKRWLDAIRARPATIAAYEAAKKLAED